MLVVFVALVTGCALPLLRPPSSLVKPRRWARRAQIDLGAEMQADGPPIAVEVENNPLSLTKHPEHGAVEGGAGEVVLGAITIAHDHSG